MTVDELIISVQEKLPQNTPIRGTVQAVNEVLETIQGEGPWTFWQKKADIVLLAEYNTGTVSMTQGDATVTGSDTTFTSAMVGRKFQSSTSEVYTVDSFTDTTHIELDIDWVGADASAKTFSIYQDTYALPSDAQRAIAFWDETLQRVVDFLPPTLIATLDKLFNTTGLGSKRIGQWGYDSDNNPEIIFFPKPTIPAKIPFWYYKRPSLVTGPSDTPDIPVLMHNTIALGLIAHYTRDSDDFVNFQSSMKKRKKEDDALLANVPVRFTSAPSLYPYRYTSLPDYGAVRHYTRHSRVSGV